MIPLDKAMICIECDIIFEGQICPLCTSHNGYLLHKWINRETAELEVFYLDKEE